MVFERPRLFDRVASKTDGILVAQGLAQVHESVGTAHARCIAIVAWACAQKGAGRHGALVGQQWKNAGLLGGRGGRTARKERQTQQRLT